MADGGMAGRDGPFLGVERSYRNRVWRLRPACDRTALALGQRHALPEAVARAMAARGVGLEAAEHHLTPTLRALMPDPSVLADMDRAADRIARAIQTDEPIAIFGDYDVDGTASIALWVRYLRAVGRGAEVYIPDRLTEGYGPNPAAMRILAERGATLVITVDCGTTAHDAMAAATEAGLDVVIVDHHTAEAGLPRAHAVVNPNRIDGTPELGQLAAVGVSFLTLVAVNRALRRAGFFGEGGPDRGEPDLRRMLDLVALATVCDVVPLTGLNRAFVAQGLKVMGHGGNPGLAALSAIAKVVGGPEVFHLGFLLGPRINAAGRIGHAAEAAQLLATDDPVEAEHLAQRLDARNEDRKEIERGVLDAARRRVEEGAGGDTAILLADRAWHPGVVGIVAGRLKDRFARPALVAGIQPDGIAKGSGRSVPGVDLGAIVLEARAEGLLVTGGGHPMAAGFSVREDRLDAFQAFLDGRVAASQAALGLGDAGVTDALEIDGALACGGASLDLARQFQALGPFGLGNPEPCHALANIRVDHARAIGRNHVKLRLSGADGARLDGIAFRALDTELGQALMAGPGAVLHLAGCLEINRWQGRETAQFRIEDAAPVY